MPKQNPAAVMAALEARRAYRAFSDQKLDRALLASLFEAARLAPSAFNEQPWRYIVATADNRPAFAKLVSCLTEMNQKWVGRAQAIMVTLARRTFGSKGTENRWRFHDAGLALANFMALATAHGLIAHPMAGFSVDRVRTEFPAIPDDFEPVAMVAIGYHGDPATLEMENHRAAETSPRSRHEVASFAFEGDWGKGFVAEA